MSNTDNGDDGTTDAELLDELRAQNERLRQRVEQHEKWLQAMMPTRRDVLVGGAAGLAGAAGMMASTGQAAAADTNSGDYGSAGDTGDFYVDEIRDEGGDVVADVDDTGDIDWKTRGFDNLSSVATTDLTLTPIKDDSLTFTGGETKNPFISSASLGDRLVVSAVPANDPDNDHGYSVDAVYWDDSTGSFKARITETESSGGGDANITAWGIGV